MTNEDPERRFVTTREVREITGNDALGPYGLAIAVARLTPQPVRSIA